MAQFSPASKLFGSPGYQAENSIRSREWGQYQEPSLAKRHISLLQVIIQVYVVFQYVLIQYVLIQLSSETCSNQLPQSTNQRQHHLETGWVLSWEGNHNRASSLSLCVATISSTMISRRHFGTKTSPQKILLLLVFNFNKMRTIIPPTPRRSFFPVQGFSLQCLERKV